MATPDRWAGERARTRNRRTGTLVVTVDAPAQGVDAGGDSLPDGTFRPWRWATICDDHGTICGHQTLALALGHMRSPDGWCEACGALRDRHRIAAMGWDAGWDGAA